ncbi:MAG TPA: hypothetical protein ENH84_05790 [Phycisphaerae bacterium]|nr:hypothetical protein [Phycisphaerae bacterium]
MIAENSQNVHDRIIVSEVDLVKGRHVSKLLALIGLRSTLSASPQQTMELIRTCVYWQAIVAAELKFSDRSLLEVFSFLPGTIALIAVIPPQRPDLEVLARRYSAQCMVRPVRVEQLAAAFGSQPLTRALPCRPPP